MPASWIDYKTKKILYIDYRNLKTEKDMLDTLKQAIELVKKSPENILTLSDVRNTYISESFFTKAKELSKDVIKPKSKKSCIIGVAGIKKIILKAFNFFIDGNLVPFDTEEDAKEYLIK